MDVQRWGYMPPRHTPPPPTHTHNPGEDTIKTHSNSHLNYHYLTSRDNNQYMGNNVLLTCAANETQIRLHIVQSYQSKLFSWRNAALLVIRNAQVDLNLLWAKVRFLTLRFISWFRRMHLIIIPSINFQKKKKKKKAWSTLRTHCVRSIDQAFLWKLILSYNSVTNPWKIALDQSMTFHKVFPEQWQTFT